MASVRGIGVAVITSTSGMHALLHQSEPLQHAEAMLLVDDREPQLLELHVLLEQRVRADHHVRQPFRHQLLELRLLAAGERSGQQHRHVAELGAGSA